MKENRGVLGHPDSLSLGLCSLTLLHYDILCKIYFVIGWLKNIDCKK